MKCWCGLHQTFQQQLGTMPNSKLVRTLNRGLLPEGSVFRGRKKRSRDDAYTSLQNKITYTLAERGGRMNCAAIRI
ncbi:Hypothetical predicted protein [Podarcis lilfordi]|uniref:Uncharacterized protein n=1 Tax=Podarcis lilfordi TaxID=74358 RepID=A0AA35LCE2_9SAUR|nr:Hypothetical predicted protein [Podarcis lilfordi]